MNKINRISTTPTELKASSPVSKRQTPVSIAQGRKWENLSNFRAGSHYLDEDLNLHSRNGFMGVINAVKHFFGAFSLSSALSGLRAAVVENPEKFQRNNQLIKLANTVIRKHGKLSKTTQVFKALFTNMSRHSTQGRVQIAYNLTRAQTQILNREGTRASSADLSRIAQGMKDVEAHASKALMKQGLPQSYLTYFIENSKALMSAAKQNGIPLATYIKKTVQQIYCSIKSPNIDSYINGISRNSEGDLIPNVPLPYKGVIDQILKKCNTDYQNIEASRLTNRPMQALPGSGKIHGVTAM